MTYPFFYDFILSGAYLETLKPKEWGKLQHNFYALQEDVIQEAITAFDPFPAELKQFYQEIGFGYFHCNKERANRIFDPYSLIMMNRLEDRFAFDVELKRSLVDGHLVFFQTFLNQYLTIDRETVNGKNAIYYKRQKISTSLSNLLSYYHNNRDHLSSEIKNIDEARIKKGIPQATLRNTFVYKPKDEKGKKEAAPTESKETNSNSAASLPPQKPTPPTNNQAQNPNKKRWTILFDDEDDSLVIG